MNVSTTPASSSARPRAERRSDTRIPCTLRVSCLSAEGAIWPALAVNVSADGARLVSFLPDRPAPLLSVQLVNQKGDSVAVPATLVHAHGDEGLWMIGCRFERSLTEGELRALVPLRRKRV
jgi:PilZ domain